jgi:hypothetical protein
MEKFAPSQHRDELCWRLDASYSQSWCLNPSFKKLPFGDFHRDLAVFQICKVNSKDLMQSVCTKETKYGFQDGTPCILLKLNRVRSTG